MVEAITRVRLHLSLKKAYPKDPFGNFEELAIDERDLVLLAWTLHELSQRLKASLDVDIVLPWHPTRLPGVGAVGLEEVDDRAHQVVAVTVLLLTEVLLHLKSVTLGELLEEL